MVDCGPSNYRLRLDLVYMTYGISGGPIEKFREGWAILPFVRKPHYWKRRELTQRYSSLCGMAREVRQGIVPLEPGVFMIDRCRHCRRYHDTFGR